MGLRSWFAASSPGTSKNEKSADVSKKGLMIKVMNSSPPSFDEDSRPLPRSPPRSRINSRDIPRTYSGLYSDEDFKPLEIHRQHIFSQSVTFFLVSYLTLIFGIQLVTDEMIPSEYSWTVTHAIHLAVTLVHVHWLKGSISDTQGELNAMTVWEQLLARGSDAEGARKVLLIVPTVLCYAGCHNGAYGLLICLMNFVLWSIAMLGKTPFMDGVRIFGINRTPGIDDSGDNDDEQTDETPDMAGAELKKQN